MRCFGCDPAVKELLRNSILEALAALNAAGALPPGDVPAFVVERTKNREHGDFAANVAMLLAKTAKAKPRDLAQAIAAALPANVQAPCVSLFQRTDGTVLTADCPVGLSRRRRRAILTSALPLGAAAVLAVTALAMLGMYQQPTTTLADEQPALAHTSTVYRPVETVTPATYPVVIDKPVVREVSGVHVAGGLRAMPPPPAPPPVKPPVGKKVGKGT